MTGSFFHVTLKRFTGFTSQRPVLASFALISAGTVDGSTICLKVGRIIPFSLHTLMFLALTSGLTFRFISIYFLRKRFPIQKAAMQCPGHAHDKPS